jgi:Glycosyl transferase family 2
MKLECVQVCVDYADYLAETLPQNLRHFDNMIVVTAPEDLETQRVCRYYGVRHAQTDVIRSRWGEFDKGKGINVGLDKLDGDSWILHLDADVALPPTTKQILANKQPNAKFLYGADRYCVNSFEAWRKHQAMPFLQQDGYHVQLNAFDLAPRFAGQRMGGYSPPGFFQLWCPHASGVEFYPEEHTSAARTDVLFASNWYANQRFLLPELVVYHLDSQQSPQGTNWNGRRAPRFGPQPDQNHPLHPRNHKGPPTWEAQKPHYSPGQDTPHNLSSPTVRGYARVGNTLTSKPGNWAGEQPIEFTYQWQRRKHHGSWIPISNSGYTAYTVHASDRGFQPRLQVKAQNQYGFALAYSHHTQTVRSR